MIGDIINGICGLGFIFIAIGCLGVCFSVFISFWVLKTIFDTRKDVSATRRDLARYEWQRFTLQQEYGRQQENEIIRRDQDFQESGPGDGQSLSTAHPPVLPQSRYHYHEDKTSDKRKQPPRDDLKFAAIVVAIVAITAMIFAISIVQNREARQANVSPTVQVQNKEARQANVSPTVQTNFLLSVTSRASDYRAGQTKTAAAKTATRVANSRATSHAILTRSALTRSANQVANVPPTTEQR